MRGRFTALRLWWKEEKKEREKEERIEGRKEAKEGRKREKKRREGRGKEVLSPGPCMLKAF